MQQSECQIADKKSDTNNRVRCILSMIFYIGYPLNNSFLDNFGTIRRGVGRLAVGKTQGVKRVESCWIESVRRIER